MSLIIQKWFDFDLSAPTGTVNQLSLSASVTETSSIQNGVRAIRLAAQATPATIVRVISHTFAAIAQAGIALVSRVSAIHHAASQGSAMSMARQAGFVRSIAQTQSSVRTASAHWIRLVSEAAVVAFGRAVTRALATSQASTAAATKRMGHAFAAITQSSAASGVRLISITRSASAETVAAFVIELATHVRAITGSVASSAGLSKFVQRVRETSAETVSAILIESRTALRTFAASVATAASLSRVINVGRAAAQLGAVSLSRSLSVVRAATAASAASLSSLKARLVTLTASVATAISETRGAFRAFTLSQISTSTATRGVRALHLTTAAIDTVLIGARARLVTLTASIESSASFQSLRARFVTLIANVASSAVVTRAQSIAVLLSVTSAATAARVMMLLRSATVGRGPGGLAGAGGAVQAHDATLSISTRVTRTIAAETVGTLVGGLLRSLILSATVTSNAVLQRAVDFWRSIVASAQASLIAAANSGSVGVGDSIYIVRQLVRKFVVMSRALSPVAHLRRDFTVVAPPRQFLVQHPSVRTFEVTMASLTFKELQPNEAWPLVFDFTPDLAPGESLTGINGSVGIVTVRGTDPTPANILNGVASLDATSRKVIVPVKPTIDGCDYRFTVAANTTNVKKTPIIVAVLPVRS